MTPALADTGFLVALFKPSDSLAASAARYLRRHRHGLLTVLPVVVETAFWLAPERKTELLTWARRGGISVADVPVAAYASLEATLRKYADQDVDIADAALVWLAGETGIHRILTVDRKDFQLFRLKGGRRFQLIEWY